MRATIACTSGGSNDHSEPCNVSAARETANDSPAAVTEMHGDGGAPLRRASVMPNGNVSASKCRLASADQSSSATMFAADARRNGAA
jgi:hypothetical protein